LVGFFIDPFIPFTDFMTKRTILGTNERKLDGFVQTSRVEEEAVRSQPVDSGVVTVIYADNSYLDRGKSPIKEVPIENGRFRLNLADRLFSNEQSDRSIKFKYKDVEKELKIEAEPFIQAHLKSPASSKNKACSSLEGIKMAEASIKRERDAAKYSGVVDQKKLYEAGQFLRWQKDEVEMYKKEYRARSGKDWSPAMCARD
jgi:hypothetical protein